MSGNVRISTTFAVDTTMSRPQQSSRYPVRQNKKLAAGLDRADHLQADMMPVPWRCRRGAELFDMYVRARPRSREPASACPSIGTRCGRTAGSRSSGTSWRKASSVRAPYRRRLPASFSPAVPRSTCGQRDHPSSRRLARTSSASDKRRTSKPRLAEARGRGQRADDGVESDHRSGRPMRNRGSTYAMSATARGAGAFAPEQVVHRLPRGVGSVHCKRGTNTVKRARRNAADLRRGFGRRDQPSTSHTGVAIEPAGGSRGARPRAPLERPTWPCPDGAIVADGSARG